MQKIYSRTTHFLTYAILLENRLKYYNKRNSVLIAVWSYNQVLRLTLHYHLHQFKLYNLHHLII